MKKAIVAASMALMAGLFVSGPVAMMLAPPVPMLAQEGPTVNQSGGPPGKAYTYKNFYDGSSRFEYQCVSESTRSRAWDIAISGATNATPIVVTTSENHGLEDGAIVTISEVQGNTAANGTFQVAVASATTLQLKDLTAQTNIAGNGTYTSGTGLLRTQAPRLNKAVWAIMRASYDGSGLLLWTKWANGNISGMSLICDSRATYGYQ